MTLQMLLDCLVCGLFAEHDNDERHGEGEDPVDKDQELGVREATCLAGRVHIVLVKETASSNSYRYQMTFTGHEKYCLCTSVAEPKLFNFGSGSTYFDSGSSSISSPIIL